MSSNKSKTELLLEAISPKEYMSFERYLTSKHSIRNINYLNYWHWKKENMQEIRKGNSGSLKPYNQTLSRKFLSDFNKLIEGFFVSVSLEHNEQIKKILLLCEMRMRRVDKLFIDDLKAVKNFNKNRVLKGFVNNIIPLRSYFEEYMILNAQNNEPAMAKIASDICRVSEVVYFQNELFSFINTYFFAGKTFETALKIDVVMKKIEVNSAFYEKEHTNVFVLYLIADLIKKSKSLNDLIKVIQYLNKREKKFTIGFLKTSYEFLFRLAAFRTNASDKRALKIAFNVFKAMERKGILKNMPHIQPFIFLTAVSLSLNIGDIDYAEKLIGFYSRKLISIPQEDVLSVCRGMLNYEKGDLRSAKNLLINLKLKNTTLYLYSKSTLIKVLYDSNEFNSITFLSDSLKHFLLRKEEVSEAYRVSIFTFLSFVANLSLAKRKNGRGLFQLRERLDLEENIFQKKWVSDKLEQLEKTFLK